MGGRERPQCFEYVVKPEEGWGRPAHELQIRPYPLPVSTYIGPVHGEPEHYRGYVTVRVPSFWEPHRLCWVNVSRDHIAFAEQVPDNELRRWKRRGWSNVIREDLDRFS